MNKQLPRRTIKNRIKGVTQSQEHKQQMLYRAIKYGSADRTREYIYRGAIPSPNKRYLNKALCLMCRIGDFDLVKRLECHYTKRN